MSQHQDPQQCLDEGTVEWDKDNIEFTEYAEISGTCTECGREFTELFESVEIRSNGELVIHT